MWDRRSLEAMQVGHALNMTADLPEHVARANEYPAAVGVACLESFFITLRLLTEFLNSRAKRALITRHDFLPGWDLPDGDRKDSLRETYKFISDQVGHLN